MVEAYPDTQSGDRPGASERADAQAVYFFEELFFEFGHCVVLCLGIKFPHDLSS